jgi:glutaminyl-tRNA synthetase
VQYDEQGNVKALECIYFPDSKSGDDKSGIKVKGTIHWLSALHAQTAEVRLYDRLFTVENPAGEEGDFKSFINPHSLEVIETAYIEPALTQATLSDRFQFLRLGYFCLDNESTSNTLIFNRTVGLKDSWAKEVKKA